MTDQTEPLEQFLAWYDRYKAARAATGLADSEYSLARAAFYAGYEARPQPQREPSRNALEQSRRFARRLAHNSGQLSMLPAPDYVQFGTVTGRLPLTGHPTGPQKRITREDTALFERGKGFEHDAPDPATLKRVHDGLQERVRDIGTGLEHVQTVWDGSDPDDTMQFGARGPVRTAFELSEGGNG